MRNFLRAEAYYMKKDSTYKAISCIFLIASIILVLWIGIKAGFDLSNLVRPLRIAISFSLFLYFVIPVHACFFSTEGFEYGSVKNIISSGQSRSLYFIGKYFIEIIAILWWIFQFFGLFYVLYIAAALITGSTTEKYNLGGDLVSVFYALIFNFLFLAAYAAVVMMLGVLLKKTTTAIVFTFVIIFGDFLLSGYLKDSSSPFFRTISENTLMTQIFKFSGQYVVNSQLVVLSDLNDYIRSALIPLGIIFVCLTTAIFSFRKGDIHT